MISICVYVVNCVCAHTLGYDLVNAVSASETVVLLMNCSVSKVLSALKLLGCERSNFATYETLEL